jgi:hypothetical protein
VAAVGVEVPDPETLIRWMLRAGAAILPLTVVAPAADPYILPKLLCARALLVILLLLHVWRAVARGRVELRRSPLDAALLLFLASAALSTVTAVNFNLALFGAYTRDEGLLTLCTYAALFWMTVQSVRTAAEARALLVVLVGSGTVVAFFAALGALIGTQHGAGAGGESAFTFAGLMRARGGFGNPNVLAAYVAMLLPVVAEMLLGARGLLQRVLAGNALLLLGTALVLTFGRSAWVGAAVGLLPVLWRHRRALWLGTVGVGAGLLLARPLAARALSLLSPGAGSGGTRLHIWTETLLMLRARLLVGWGPDTFGLVYPRFQEGRWTPGFVVDKAHSDLLQVAATQGDVGVFAYLWAIFAGVRAAWRGRAEPWGAALLGALLAYEVTMQVNFSWFPAGAPFWMLLGAAVVVWSDGALRTHTVCLPRMSVRTRSALVAVACALGVLAVYSGTVRPMQADIAYADALRADAAHDVTAARDAIALARALAPWESRYAAAAGDIALGMHGDDAVSPDADWAGARAAYADAGRLGTSDADDWRHLAMAAAHLGDLRAAREAARTARDLDRWDIRNARLLARLGG